MYSIMNNEWSRNWYQIKRINSNYNLTTLDSIKMGLAAITERLMGINSISPNEDVCLTEIERIGIE